MKIYESKPWYLWIIAFILAYFFIFIISPFDIYFTIIWGIIIVIVGFNIKKFEFYSDIICKKYIFRPFFKKKFFDYQKIHLIEVRNLKEPYNRPYVILHFSNKKINSINFANRSFLYDSVTEIKPLIEHCVIKKIPIKLNFSFENHSEKIYLIEVIEKNGGQLY